MRDYLNLVKSIIDDGETREDRTGHGTKSLFGTMLKFDLVDGFPATTCKKLAFGQVAAELACFLKGHDNQVQFETMGCNIWKGNADAPYWWANPKRRGDGDLGRIYGVQWRRWRGTGPTDPPIDQLRNAVELLRKDPWTRRAVVSAWNAAEVDEVCLPPCHTAFQFTVKHGSELHCFVTMRSVDVMLGLPFDQASYALLTHIVARELGLYAGGLTMTIADTHIYLNHIERCREMLGRSPLAPPGLELDHGVTIDNFKPYNARLIEYTYHPAIRVELNV